MRVLKQLVIKSTLKSLFPLIKLIGKNSRHINIQGLTNEEKVKFASITADLIKKFRVEKADFSYYDLFDFWQSQGFHITPNHFYQPIPDTSKMSESIFKKKSELIGVNMNEKKQLDLLKNVFVEYQKEFKDIPTEPDSSSPVFSFNNLAFDGVDALVYYCMIRNLKPKTVLEIGSGWSTKIAAKAALLNKNTQLVCVEPYPQPILKKGFKGLNKVIAKDVQELPMDFFNRLSKNDILFIDSTHTVKTGGDVNYLFLEILPRLKKGVVIHIHDIFLPFEYPKEWVIDEKRFWAEQYLLQAFLQFNDSFQIIYSNSYMGSKYPKLVKKTFPNSPFTSGGSIWIKKIK